MSLTLDQLKAFCASPQEDHRTEIFQPWSVGQFTFSTDGKIIIRVPRMAEVPENPSAPKGALELFGKDDIQKACSSWRELPLFPKPKWKECDQCKGSGSCPDDHGFSGTCDDCNGQGEYKLMGRIQFLGRDFQDHLLEKLEDLPDLLCADIHYSKMQPMYFKFEGGDGLIMPMAPESGKVH